LNDKSCLNFAYDGGSLSCDSECDFDYASCTITSSSGSPSGGGGTPTGEEASEEVSVEEKSVEVKTEVKAEEEPLLGSGEVTKEEIKPKSGRFSRIWEIIKNFFYGIFRWIFDWF